MYFPLRTVSDQVRARAIISVLVLGLVLPVIAPLVMATEGVNDHHGGDDLEDPVLIHMIAGSFDPLNEGPDLPEGLMFDGTETNDQYIIQLKGPIFKHQRETLVSNRADIIGYLPDYAYLVVADRSDVEAMGSLPFVRAIAPMHPGLRLAPSLWSEEGSVDILIETINDMDLVVSRILSYDGHLTSAIDGTILATVPGSVLYDLARMAPVLWIERAPIFRISNDVSATIMNVNATWNTYGLNGSSQIVAVADTGLDTGVDNDSMHDDLEGRIVAITELYPTPNDGANDTRSGHGTHVAGSVLGNGSKSNGKIKGPAYGARLYFQAMEDNSNGAFATPAPIDTQVFQPAYTAGARVHTNSWGGSVSDGTYTSSSRAVDRMVWNNDDLVILFAVGNDGVDSNSDGIVDADSIDAPSTAKNCIAIGASEGYRPSKGWAYSPATFPQAPINGDKSADDYDGMAAFSSRGFVNDSRVKPDLVAPGSGILSLRSSEATGTGWGLPAAAEGDSTYYMFNGGTSMATPLAAGVATLVRDFYVTNESIDPSAALIKATMINGADDMPGQYASPQNDTGPVWDHNQGWGRINLTNSIFPAPRDLIYDDQTHPLDTNENFTYQINVTGSNPFRITLVYSDYYALAAANPALVNDLDLKVTAPNSTVYVGNRFSNGESTTGGSADNRNNVENVYFNSPSLGTYTIEVNASNVPQGPQAYAIVISGVFLADPSNPPILSAPASGDLTGTRPTFNMSAFDINGDDVKFRIELSKDDFGSIWRTVNQTVDTTGWSKPIYESQKDALYTIKVGDELDDDVKYYWRALAWDGTNWSNVSTVWNFTVDGEAPTSQTIAIDSGANSTNSLSVTLTLSATDDDSGLSGGLSGMSFSQDATSWTSWEGYGVSKNLNLEDFQGPHRVYFRTRDTVGNVADAVSSTIIYDNVAPTGLTLSIDSGASLTNSTTVDLTLSATDSNSGLWQMSFSNDGSSWSSWKNFASLDSGWDLTDAGTGGSSNDGDKTVHFRARDNARNVANVVSSSIKMDTTLPMGVQLNINGGDLYTTSRLVHLSTSASDVTSGIGTISFNVDDAGYGPWEPFVTSKFIMLSAGNGPKSVKVLVRDEAGNVANEVEATITFDNEPPLDLGIVPDENITVDQDITFTLSATDTLSGLADMSFGFDGLVWTDWVPYAGTKDLVLPEGDGTKTVYFRVRDNAGNLGGPVLATLILDTSGPMFTLTINGGATYTNSVTVDIEFDLLEAGALSDLEVSISNDQLDWSPFETLASPMQWDLAIGDGEKMVYVTVRDMAGNEKDAQAPIELDMTQPYRLSIVINNEDAYTTGTMVRCSLQAFDENGLSYMAFSLDGTIWSQFEPWSSSKSLEVSHGNGVKTIHLKVLDPAGNEATVQATIVLDEDLPEIYSFNINNGSKETVNYISSTDVSFKVSADDEGSDLSEMSFSYDGLTWGEWLNYSEEGHMDLLVKDGPITVYVRVRDNAGNIADPTGAMVVIDTQAPTSVSVLINDDDATTDQVQVTLRMSAMDMTSGLGDYRWREGDDDWSNWYPFTTTKSIRVSTGEGERTIHLEVRDKAGNVAEATSDSIKLVGAGTEYPELTVKFTSHSGGDVLKDTVRFTGTISGGTPTSVDIRIDGGAWKSLEKKTSWSYTWDTIQASDGAHIVEVRANNGKEYSYSAPMVFNVKNKSDTINTSNQGVEGTSLLLVIIIAAAIGAAAGGGVAAAMRPKRSASSMLEVESKRTTKASRSKDDPDRGRGGGGAYGHEDLTCPECGYEISSSEGTVVCECGKSYHEDCAESAGGYCRDCGGNLY